MRVHGRPGVVAAFALFWLVAAAAHAAELRVLLDTDNNPATGCSVSLPNPPGGTFGGVESILVTTVNTAVFPPVVTAVATQACVSGSTFGPATAVSGGGWPVGIGLGVNGYDVIETFLPLASPYGTYRLGFVYDAGAAGGDALVTSNGAPIVFVLAAAPTNVPIPTLSPVGILLLTLALAGLAFWVLRRHKTPTLLVVALVTFILSTGTWAAIVLDGMINDWSNVPVLAYGNNGGPNHFSAVFASNEGTRLYFRADVKVATAPAAVNDSYATNSGVPLGVAAPGILGNDTLGSPPATVTSYGGGSLGGAVTDHAAGTTTTFAGGGSLTVNANGSFTYTPAAGFTGAFTFMYAVTNVAGTSSALVTVNTNQPPAITSSSSVTFTVGTAGTFAVTTTGSPSPTLTMGACTPALPAGITFTDNGNGTATLAGTAPAGSVGTYAGCTIVAQNGFAPNATQSFTLIVAKAASSTAVVANPTPSIVGQPVTFTATVTTTAGGGASPPTGTVDFVLDGAPVATGVALDGAGQATFTTGAMTIAGSPHTMVVSYAGNANLNASSGSATHTVGKANSASVVVSSQNPSVIGQPVTFTATVSATAPASGTPTGTVSFMDGAVVLASNVALAAGSASFTTSALAGGAHNVTVVYSGDASFNASTSPILVQTVSVASSTTALARTGGPNPSAFGEQVTFTATVTATPPASGTPAGNVAFMDGATLLGTVALAGGAASFSTTALSVAGSPHSVTAQYQGDANFNGSTSNAVSQTVSKGNTLTAVGSSANPSLAGQPVTFTATVSAVAPAAGVPTGTVTFTIDGIGQPPIAIAAGAASFTTSALTPGSHTVSATYNGDGNFNTSTGALPTQAVNQAPVAVADACVVNHDTSANACPNLLANDTAGFPPGITLASVTGNGAPCTVFPCTITTTNGAAGGVVVQSNGNYTYTPAPGYAGGDSFGYSITNGVGSSSAAVSITVSNAAPVIDLNGAQPGVDFGPVSFSEGGSPVAIVGTVSPDWLTITDSDSTNLASATVVITNVQNAGEEALAVTCPSGPAPACSGAIQATDIVPTASAGTFTLTITRVAPLADYEALLRSLAYVHSGENPTLSPDRVITVTINDGIVSSAPATATVQLVSVNDAPTITAPASVNGQINTAIAFTGANSVSVADPDAGSSPIQVTLTGTNGTISALGSTAGLTVSPPPPAGTVVLTGPLSNINVAFAGLAFTPTGASGVSLKVDANDQGNTGSGGAKTDSKTIAVTLDPRPTVTGMVPVNGATGVAPNSTVQVNFSENVTVSAGSFTLACPANVAFVLGGSGANYVLTPTANLPVGATCTLTVVAANVTDGIGQTMASDFTGSFTVAQAPVVVTTGGATTFTEGGGAVAIDAGLTVSDADSANLTGGSVQITSACNSAEDVLGFVNQNGIAGAYSAATCALTLTGSSSVANYQTALRSVTYNNTSNNPNTTPRVATFVVNDGSFNSAAATKSVTVVSVNSAPQLANGSTLNYTENGAPAPINAAIVVTDADSTNLVSATVSITANLAAAEDVLGFANTATITGSYNAGTGVLTLTGADTLANYQAALRSVTYANTSESPSTLARTVSFRVNDGGAANNLSNIVTSTVNVTAVNDAPVLAGGSTLSYAENDPATVINGVITVSDVDSATLVGATVSITANFASGQDVLSLANLGPITGSYSAATGVLTLTGTDTLANYQAALRTVKYNNSSENPSTAARTVAFQVNDGAAANNLSNSLTSTITVTAVNDAPTLSVVGSLTYTENQAAASLIASATITDPDSANMSGATVQITGNYANGQDVLSYVAALGITGSFNAATGTLTLTGTTTLANYQTALANVKYANTSENPSTAVRTVTWRVDDGGAANNLSNQPTSTITVIAVNDPPVAVALSNLPAQAGIPITYPAGTLGGSDPEGSAVTIATTPDSLCAGCLLTINGNGSFTFTPPPLAAGTTVSFTYHVTDVGVPPPNANSAPATVSFVVAGPAIFFVKSVAVGSGNCTLGNECTLATAVTNIGAATNTRIFIGDANNHSAAVPLTASSWLVGQGVSTAFDTLFGINPPAQGTLLASPSTGQARPTVQNTVTVNSNSTVRGLNISTTGNTGLAGGAVSGVTLNEASLTASAATAISFNGTGGTMTLDSVSSTGGANNVVLTNVTGTLTMNGGALSGATAKVFNVTGGNGSVSYAGTFTNAGTGLTVANKTGGTVTFSGATKTLTTGANTAVTLSSNTGATVDFSGGGLTITTTSGGGFSATGGGTVSVTGASNTIASGTGTALTVTSTTIGSSGLNFVSISANGGASGIVLSSTGAGGLTVAGTGVAGSGGTIQNTTGRGASFIGSQNISLSRMNFTNTATSDLDADNSGLTTGDNLVTNAAIHLETITNVTLNGIAISGSAEQGINGHNVTNFTLSNSSIANAGNGPDEDGIHFYNMLGTSSITNTTITSSGDDNINIQNNTNVALPAGMTPVLNLTITGGSANTGVQGSGYLMGIRGTSTATVTIDGVTANNNFSGGIVIDTYDTATSTIEIKNSTSTNNNDAISLSSNNGNTKFDIHDNVSFAGTDFGRINILKAAFSTGGTLQGKIRNNPIVVTDGQTADGISVFHAGGGTLTVGITNNTFAYRGTQRAINIQGGQDGAGQLNATVTGNTIDMQLDGTNNAVTGIIAQVAVASPSGDNLNMCADIGGAGALRNTYTHTLGGNMPAGDIRVRQRFVTTVTLPGYAGANNDNAAVVAYLAGRNTLVNSPTATATNEIGVTPGAGGFVGGASCAQPVFP